MTSDKVTHIGSSKLGFFSKPVLLTDGPHAGKVMKSYKFVKSRKLCEELLSIHANYVPQLEKAGIAIPQTEAEIVEHKGNYSIRIYQKAFHDTEMTRKMMETGDAKTCLFIMNGVLNGAITALNYLHEHPETNMGFHPTLRNYAVRDGKFWYFDTFPPMANLAQSELEWYILHFSPYKVPGWFKKIAKPMMNRVTDEYYHPDKMFLGIVGSSCRLRPEFQALFLDEAKKMAENLKNISDRNAILTQLQKPPKLPFIWTFTRKLLGKEGKGNLSR